MNQIEKIGKILKKSVFLLEAGWDIVPCVWWGVHGLAKMLLYLHLHRGHHVHIGSSEPSPGVTWFITATHQLIYHVP